MATGIAQPKTLLPPAPPVPGESQQRDRIIRQQLARTGMQVRLVDLACSLAVLIIGVLLLFIGAALFDHFVGLGTVGRFVVLAAFVGSSLWYLAMHVGPLLVRTINPAYAARTIEEATPTLKNSLINFLLLRQDRSGLKEIVFQAVEQQAAADIATVPVEATVDRTRLIYAGYALCGVMAVVAVYKIFSPKDPFQTVARVLAPWAEIARPSRVQISEVKPGSAEVYHGQRVPISAIVRGAREGDKVKVLYSTADGQTIDQPIEMKLSAGDHYECQLPPEPSGSAAAGGLLQNAVYRIVAGDAETFPFRLTVVSAPTIIVDRLENQYPAYTKKPADSLRQQGDIKALEGTKVTIHAIANQPIKSAWIEFDPTTTDAAAETVPLVAEGDHAQGTMTLQLRPDRQTPWHATYQVRFYNERGQRSQQPILHKIEVIRDLAPEVQILAPERLRVEVPEDGEQTIEVRAVDPDFALANLRIEGAASGKPPVSINLLDESAGQQPQITVPYAFRPREHSLSTGDEFRYAAVAEDNRTSPLNGQSEPNITRTKDYTLVITAPQSNERGQAGKNQQPAGGAAQKNQPNSSTQKAEQQPDKNSQKGQQGKTEPPQPDQKNQPMNDGGQGNQDQKGKTQEPQKNPSEQNQQQPNREQGEQQQNNQQSGDSKQEESQQQSGKQQEGQQNQPQQSGQEKGNQGQGGQQSNQKGGGEQQGQSGGKSGSGSQQSGNSSGGGEAGNSASEGGRSGQESGNQQQPSGQPGDRPDGADSAAGGRGENSGKAQHDGQAIERIWKDLERRNQEQPQNGQSPMGGENQQGKPNEANHGQGRGEPLRSDENQASDKSQPNDKTQAQPMPGSKEAGDKGQKSGSEQGSQPQADGSSSAQNQNVPNAGRPEGNDQQLNPKGAGEQPKSKTGDANQRLPDDKEGQNPSEQQSGGNKGGAPRGPSQTDKGEKSSSGKGENRDPGAGNTGQEGAGQASPDKTGSAEGTSNNRDRDKQMPPDGNKAEKGDTSPASSSKKQSDSKGGESGAESGGGKKGAGQSAGQEGNDSAGSKSAGDQGAGKANETGGGETGSKAGEQQKAGGKTGQSGAEKGEGSASRTGNDSQDPGSKGGQPSAGDANNASQKSDSREPAIGGEAASQPIGGTGDGSQRSPTKANSTEEQEADAANLEYARKATEMVLRKLKEEEHNPDPELLDKLGWTRDDLAEFLRRWDALQKSAAESPSGKHELDEALKTLGLRDPATRRRAGGKVSDQQRDLRDTGNRSAPPPKYRDLFDAFRKGAARSAP